MTSPDLLNLPFDLSLKTLPAYMAGVRMYILDTPASSEARKTAIAEAAKQLNYGSFVCRKNKKLAAQLDNEAAKLSTLQDTQA